MALAGAAGVAVAVAVFVADARHLRRAEMAASIAAVPVAKREDDDILKRCKGFMAPPVTDVRVLRETGGSMCTRMEMLIMETQAEFCRALEKVDGGKFKADRWQRAEGESTWGGLGHFPFGGGGGHD